MKQAVDVRVGNLLLIDGKIYKVEAVEMKGSAKVHKTVFLKMKDIIDGKDFEHTYQQDDKIEEADVRHRKADYSYHDGTSYYFIDEENFENYEVPSGMIGDKSKFLKENEKYQVEVYEGRAIDVVFPPRIKLQVTTSPPGIKQGDSTTDKEVTLENGMTVNAPQFIEEGDTVEIDTETEKYIDRVQE
ncbi:MAG: elongation factor P [Candidatus Omnitrophica bacterium]|nr:elongation factor P [Candidatus Omnitrophota bacterium]